MTPEQTTEALDLLKKQLRVQKRTFAIQLVQMISMGILASMVLYVWIYSA